MHRKWAVVGTLPLVAWAAGCKRQQVTDGARQGNDVAPLVESFVSQPHAGAAGILFHSIRPQSEE